MLIGRVYNRFKLLYMSVICWFVVTYPRICYCLYNKNLGGMSKQMFLSELAKYARLFNAHSKRFGARQLQSQVYAFTHNYISVISDTLRLAENPCEPIVLTVVRDDLERMKLFYQHYRNLGVKQFVVIDNGSTDGTLEWVSKQQETRCYQISAKFLTESKVSWIEKVLALTGYNRWYVVVDSDELLDYIGREQHNLKDLILYANDKGYKHLNGYMVDMYSDQPLFVEDCGYSEIVSRFRYFDASGYFLKNHGSWVLDMEVCSLKGGSRARLFKNKEISLNKQSVFYYEPDTLYCHPHYFWPYSRWDKRPCSFVLRHYKFLKQDLHEFEKRVVEKTFWNGSKEYRSYIDAYHSNSGIGMKNEESKEYTGSFSLSVLPFLESPFMNEKRKSMNKLFSIFNPRPVWLVSERGNDARDNGYWMFKYLQENHPEINSKYVISKNSADRKKLAAWNKGILTQPSLKLLYYMIKAECLLTAHFHNTFFLPLPLINRVIAHILRRKPTIRLQHGITKDDLSQWLKKLNCRTDIFVCSAAPEYEYLKTRNIYPSEVFRYTGFARYDGLVNEAEGNRQILIMPTWRHWIKTEVDFMRSDYYKEYVSLLTDEHFQQFLHQNGLHAIFYLHHCFQKYTPVFTRLNLPSCITIASKDEEDVQELLKQSNILVTDYSSVAFDFAYLQKPVIYYQFDEEVYRKKQFPEGFFDYHKGLGPWTARKDELLHEIENCVASNFEMESKYRERANDIFIYHDQNNCERIYQEVIRTIRKK